MHGVLRKALLKGFYMESEKPDPDVVKMIDIIDEFLAESEDTPKRVFKIKELLSYLNYNLRLTELSDEELNAYRQCVDGPVLSDQMRATLEGCKTEDGRKYYTDMWARSVYFRRCAWDEYLYGETDKKPFVAPKETPTESPAN